MIILFLDTCLTAYSKEKENPNAVIPGTNYNISPPLSADHHDGHHSHDHSHDPGVSSVSIVCEGNLDLEKVGSVHMFCIFGDSYLYD